jgi:hypothetical protein
LERPAGSLEPHHQSLANQSAPPFLSLFYIYFRLSSLLRTHQTREREKE